MSEEIKGDNGAGPNKYIKTQFPSNANNKKLPEKKEVKKVVSGPVVRRKKSLGKKFAETFTGDDARSVASYVFLDVMVPAAKSMVSDMVSQGIERLLFGSSSRQNRNHQSNTYISYNNPTGRAGRPDGRREISHRARATHDFDEIILPTREDAENVIDGLQNLIETYGVASVADLYDLLDITGSFTDDKWGWVKLRDASVDRVREGYFLNIPKPEALD